MTEPLASPAPTSAVTVRGLAPELKARLRVRAAHNARSMEAEARAILEAALTAPEEDPTDLATFARGLFAPLGGIELELPFREPARKPPALGEHGPAQLQAPTAAPAKPLAGGGGAKAPDRHAAGGPSAGRRRR